MTASALPSRLRWAPVLVFLAWATTAFYRHVDVSDANLYRVIARHLVEDDAWLSLRYLPTAYPHFFEHLPFGLWPMAVVIRLFGEGALPLEGLLVGAMTVALVGLAARQLAGEGAGLVAAATLALTQNFFFLSTLTLLDGPLLLGAALSLVGLSRPRLDGWFIALTLLGALVGVATKGPFGLLTPIAMLGARSLLERDVKAVAMGGLLVVAAVAPIALFVWTSPAWLEGYGRNQLLGSMTGARMDGDPSRGFALISLLQTAWPALGVLPLSLPPLRQRLAPGAPLRPLALVSLALVAVVVGLSLPTRKVAHHVFVAFPLTAVWAGVVVGPALERLPRQRVAAAFAVLVAAGLVAGPLGIARFYCGPPCAFSTVFAEALSALPAGSDIEVVATDSPWPSLSALSAERRLVPIHVHALGDSHTARWAIVEARLWAPTDGWLELARAGELVLVRRP